MNPGFRLEPITPGLGATVRGIDLREPLGAGVVEHLRRAWLDHLVLWFPDQPLTLDQQKVFARNFGELWIHPTVPAPDGHPEVLVVRTREGAEVAPGQGWHTDMPAAATPPSGSLLRLEKVPSSGGDTMFCNMYAAYDALSEHWRRFLDPLDAWQSGIKRHGRTFGMAGDHPEALHPVVRRHPETGRKALFVNQGFTTHIEGMSEPESDAVLEFLYRHCENPAFHMRLRWQPDSMALWDNRCVMHNAINDYDPGERLGYRLTLAGDRPTR